MTILLIAPLPPPTHGQSLASDVLYQRLRQDHDVRVVDMAKPTARHVWDRLRRVPKVLGFLAAISRKARKADIVYLTISESRLGNLKDLFIYSICFGSLGSTFIHLLGGAGIRRILERRGLQSYLNRFFIARLRGVIVEGRTQARTFAGIIPDGRIHVAPNFAEDFLFVTDGAIENKFSQPGALNVLFLSNLYTGKGHVELVDAYLSLAPRFKERLRITFVGGFESTQSQTAFLARIDGQYGLVYLGSFIAGDAKKALYGQSQIFCLPTYYPYEGQPISILEAYATGCVVVTTEHSGIPDVFTDGVNGFAVAPRSPASIRGVLETIVDRPEGLVAIALTNRRLAHERYRTDIYQSSLIRILESPDPSAVGGASAVSRQL